MYDREQETKFDLTTEQGYFDYFKHIFYWHFEWEEEKKQASQPKEEVTHGSTKSRSKKLHKQVLRSSSEEAENRDFDWDALREFRKKSNY